MAKKFLSLILQTVGLPILTLFAVLARQYRGLSTPVAPRLLWGATPIISHSIWSQAMRQDGFSSQTFTFDYYSSINSRNDWDIILSECYGLIPRPLKIQLGFLFSLFKFDFLFTTCDGFLLGPTSLWWLEPYLLKIAGIRIVILPYGSDSYVYHRIRNPLLIHGLNVNYRKNALNASIISRRIYMWQRHADVFIPGVMGNDGFDRCDVLMPSNLAIDVNKWKPSSRIFEERDGIASEVIIVHSPNHRGAKGTEFLAEAVRRLQSEGVKCKLMLLEGVKNSQVKHVLENEADILVEQLLQGHGLSFLEGMAAGIPVITNFEDDNYWDVFRHYSFFSECPGVSAGPGNIYETLKVLIENYQLRKDLGIASRKYAEKYHGLDSAQYLFRNVIDFALGKSASIVNLYHPILGHYKKETPKITHPLRNNKITHNG